MQASDLIPLDAPVRVKMADLCQWFGVTQNAVWKWVQNGRIPPPIVIGARTHLYDTEGIRAAFKAEEAAREAKRARVKQT